MTAKMRYAALQNFDNPLFATHLLVHEKSIWNINSILINNKCRTDLYKFVNKYLLKHNKIFHISVTCPEIYGYSYNIFLHNSKNTSFFINKTTYYYSQDENSVI